MAAEASSVATHSNAALDTSSSVTVSRVLKAGIGVISSSNPRRLKMIWKVSFGLKVLCPSSGLAIAHTLANVVNYIQNSVSNITSVDGFALPM